MSTTYTTPSTTSGGIAYAELTETTSNAALNKSTYSGRIGIAVTQDGTSGIVSATLYNGSTQLGTYSYLCTAGGATQWLTITSFDIAHSASGNGTWQLRLVVTHLGNTQELNQTVSCAYIERRASISISGNKTLGASETITPTKLFSTASTRLLVKTGGGYNYELAPKTSGSLSCFYWRDLARYMSSMSQSATVTLQTYDGDSLVGTYSYAITLVIDANAYTLTATINSCTPSAYSAYVQNKSGAVVSASGALGGAYSDYVTSVSKIEFSLDSMSGTISSASGTWTSGNFSSSGSVTLTITVYDNHGKTATATQTLSVTAYTAPSISAFTAVRSGSNNVNYSFTLNKTMDWEFSGVATASGSGSGTITGSFTLADTSSGTLTLTAEDEYDGAVAMALIIPTAGCYIARKTVNGTKSVCIGDFVDDTLGAEHEGFDVAVPVYCRNDSQNHTGFGDVVVEQGVGGTNNMWVYRKWSSGIAECWAYVDGYVIGFQDGGSTTWNTGGQATWYRTINTVDYPTGLFVGGPATGDFPVVMCSNHDSGSGCGFAEVDLFSTTQCKITLCGNWTAISYGAYVHALGRWK